MKADFDTLLFCRPHIQLSLITEANNCNPSPLPRRILLLTVPYSKYTPTVLLAIRQPIIFPKVLCIPFPMVFKITESFIVYPPYGG